MKKIWYDKAWEDYLFWQDRDRRQRNRINQLIKEIERAPFAGIGKPEPLKGEFAGFWSRRIDEKHRLVYRIQDGILEIVSCRGHYND